MGLTNWSGEDLQGHLEGGGTALVDLRADWCPQCGPQEGVIERVAPEFSDSVSFASVDVEDHPEVVERYRVQSLPTLLLFKNGELHQSLIGFKRAPLVRQALLELTAD